MDLSSLCCISTGSCSSVFCSFPPSILCFSLPGFPHLNFFFLSCLSSQPSQTWSVSQTQDCVHCFSFFPRCSSFFSQIFLVPLFSILFFMWIAYVFILVGSSRGINENKFRCQWSILIVRKASRPIRRWLCGELMCELQCKNGMPKQGLLGQATKGKFRKVILVCRDEIKRASAHLEMMLRREI